WRVVSGRPIGQGPSGLRPTGHGPEGHRPAGHLRSGRGSQGHGHVRFWSDTAALARKDLLLELRAREVLPAMLLFVLSALVVFHFALPADASDDAATGLLWVAIVFTALLGLTRAFAPERDQGTMDGL